MTNVDRDFCNAKTTDKSGCKYLSRTTHYSKIKRAILWVPSALLSLYEAVMFR